MADGDKTPNRRCQTCGAPYYFCSCHANQDKFHWKLNCCTPVHFQIFLTALDLRDGRIDEAEARARLSNVGFGQSDLSWCVPATAGILSRAFERRAKE